MGEIVVFRKPSSLQVSYSLDAMLCDAPTTTTFVMARVIWGSKG